MCAKKCVIAPSRRSAKPSGAQAGDCGSTTAASVGTTTSPTRRSAERAVTGLWETGPYFVGDQDRTVHDDSTPVLYTYDKRALIRKVGF